MNLAKIAPLAVLGLTVVAGGTLALPRHVHVERTATMGTLPVDAVLGLAASNSGYQRFNPYRNTDPDLVIELFGPERGVGSGFRFDGEEGTGTQTVAEVSDEEVVYTIDLGSLGQPTQAIRAVPTEQGTEVTWRMEADMGFNPLFRVMGLFMDSMVGPTFERGLANLADVSP